MAKTDYVHMRYKNDAIACFARTEEVVEHDKCQEQLERHGNTAEIWLFRSNMQDWHRYEAKEGRNKGHFVRYPESKVPAKVVQYVNMTAE